MLPIPRNMLPHSCELREPLSEDEYGKIEYSEGVTLNHVKIEPSAALAADKQNRELRLSAVLIYDCRSSSGLPEGGFRAEQAISFNGIKYSVKLIDVLYDNRKRPHHYEVGLI